MTVLTSDQTAGLRSFALLREAPKMRARPRDGEEDGARRAMGGDTQMPIASLPGRSLEHLARIALG